MGAGWRPRNVPVPEAYLVGVAVGLAAHAWRPWPPPWPGGLGALLGWPLAIGGTIVIVAAVRAAGPVDLERPGRLVTDGPYAYSRNPMYLGWALIVLAAGLLTRSVWVLAALPLAAAWTHRDVRREERRLAEAFGPEFATYRATVRRYLGRSRPSGPRRRPR
jgi:protein-S-isoprenylcysteine O-methyltransferase Ste14